MQEVIKQEADALIQQPVKIAIDIQPRNSIEKWLQRKKLLPKKRMFLIHPMVLGSLIRISKLIADLEVSIDKLDAETSYNLIKDHGRTMATIAAIAVTNERKEPTESLINFFLYRLTSNELASLVNVVLKQMDVQSFLVATISAKNLRVIEMNPSQSS